MKVKGEPRNRKREEGFTLVEMMVVIIIVGILAAVAVPLYTGYVEKSKLTEATSIMGAIITSEKLEKQRTGCFYEAADHDAFKAKGMVLDDTRYFTYSVTINGACPADDFVVTANTVGTTYGADGGWVKYDSAGADNRWTCDGTVITNDMIPEG